MHVPGDEPLEIRQDHGAAEDHIGCEDGAIDEAKANKEECDRMGESINIEEEQGVGEVAQFQSIV